MTERSLTFKQKRFVEEFLINLNSTQAATRAGYSPKTARFIGSENLTKPDIAAAIQKAMDERAERCELKADAVLKELACIAFSNMGDYASWGPDGVRLKDCSELSDDAAAAVKEVSETKGKENRTLRFKLHDKVAALEKLGRHLKLFTDMVQVSYAEELRNLSDEELYERARKLESRAAEVPKCH